MPTEVFEKRRNGKMYSVEVNFNESDFIEFLRAMIPEEPNITNHLTGDVAEAMADGEITFAVKGSSPGRNVHITIKLPTEVG